MGASAMPFLDEGIIVTATDYEGLGTPGVHPYIVGESEGRGVVDIVRAARHLSFAHAGDRFVVWGHSQGGHAALFANQIAPTWAPELHLLGTEAGAPATELPLLGALFQGLPDQSLVDDGRRRLPRGIPRCRPPCDPHRQGHLADAERDQQL